MLHDGRLVVYQGRRATEWVAARPRGTSTLATDAGIGGVTALTPARLVTEASFPVDAASFVWQALQHGWLPVPATPVGHLHDERRGRYDSVAIRLHAVR